MPVCRLEHGSSHWDGVPAICVHAPPAPSWRPKEIHRHQSWALPKTFILLTAIPHCEFIEGVKINPPHVQLCRLRWAICRCLCVAPCVASAHFPCEDDRFYHLRREDSHLLLILNALSPPLLPSPCYLTGSWLESQRLARCIVELRFHFPVGWEENGNTPFHFSGRPGKR